MSFFLWIVASFKDPLKIFFMAIIILCYIFLSLYIMNESLLAFCYVNNFWNRIFEHSELKFLISVASKITDICQKFGSLAIITESDFTKLKNFVKYYYDEISNFRNVKFFKIAAGSAHVWSALQNTPFQDNL